MSTLKTLGATVAEFRDDEAPEFTVDRSDETGDVTLEIEMSSGDVVRINVGRFYDSAEGLAGALEGAAKDVRSDILEGWEDTPDFESDGWVSESRDGYFVALEGVGRMDRHGYPSREIAVYELAQAMADAGCFPNAWYQNERGNIESVGDEVRKYHDAGGDKMLPLEGVRYESGTRVTNGSEGWPWVVVKDYGRMGVVIHMSGDPSIGTLADHDDLSPYDEDEDD